MASPSLFRLQVYYESLLAVNKGRQTKCNSKCFEDDKIQINN